jgi:hypothetical protein
VVVGHDPAPQQVPEVRRQRADGHPVAVHRQRVEAEVGEPERVDEAVSQGPGAILQPEREPGIAPHVPEQPRRADQRVVGVALDLAGGVRQRRDPAVGVHDRVGRILPALHRQAGHRIPGPVRDEPGVQPGERGAGGALQLAHGFRVAGPAFVLVEHDQEQRGGVGRAVVGRVRTLAEVDQFAVAQLVRDLARLRVPEVVDGVGLQRGEGAQRGPAQVGRERQRLVAGDQAVPAEEGHEPRQARRGCGTVKTGRNIRDEAQRGQVGEAGPVHAVQVVPAGFETRQRGQPFLRPHKE